MFHVLREGGSENSQFSQFQIFPNQVQGGGGRQISNFPQNSKKSKSSQGRGGGVKKIVDFFLFLGHFLCRTLPLAHLRTADTHPQKYPTPGRSFSGPSKLTYQSTEFGHLTQWEHNFWLQGRHCCISNQNFRGPMGPLKILAPAGGMLALLTCLLASLEK